MSADSILVERYDRLDGQAVHVLLDNLGHFLGLPLGRGIVLQLRHIAHGNIVGPHLKDLATRPQFGSAQVSLLIVIAIGQT